MKREDDAALALMVYETWLLNGATEESMPSLKLRKWCNRQLGRHLFPLPSASVEPVSDNVFLAWVHRMVEVSKR